jgi:hypothetical protein
MSDVLAHFCRDIAREIEVVDLGPVN